MALALRYRRVGAGLRPAPYPHPPDHQKSSSVRSGQITPFSLSRAISSRDRPAKWVYTASLSYPTGTDPRQILPGVAEKSGVTPVPFTFATWPSSHSVWTPRAL